jgi:hypothetical protein
MHCRLIVSTMLQGPSQDFAIDCRMDEPISVRLWVRY